MDKNNIIFLLGRKNTYNNLVYNTLNDCIDASTIFKNEINWKIPKLLNIINHSSNNENNYSSGPLFCNKNDGYFNSENTSYQKEVVDVYLIYVNGIGHVMYRPCISIHE